MVALGYARRFIHSNKFLFIYYMLSVTVVIKKFSLWGVGTCVVEIFVIDEEYGVHGF